MLNIQALAVEETLTFQLTDADDSPLFDGEAPCMATVYGPGSRRYAQATSRRQNRMLAKAQRGQAANETAEEKAKHQAEFLADVTEDLGIEYTDADGKPLEGRPKLIAIYGDARIGFIAEQVARKSGDWANFKRGSAKS